ncbi:KTSC domain-containing protein [Streptomyces roseifaciens]
MPPRRRRAIGRRNPRAAINRGRNTGVTPYRTIAEQEFYGAGQAPRPRTSIQSRPDYSPADIRDAIDQASQNLGKEKREALKRATWLWDDGQLLDVRPTNTSWPGASSAVGPRTLAAGYDAHSHTLFVRFRGRRTGPAMFEDGVGYEYYDVTPREWETFKDNWSPGRYINKVLNGKPYTPTTW